MRYRTVKNPYPFPIEEESTSVREQIEADRKLHSPKSALIVETPMWCEECRFYDADWCMAFGDSRDLDIVDTSIHKPDWCPLKELPKKVTEEESGAYVSGFMDALVSEVDDESNISD